MLIKTKRILALLLAGLMLVSALSLVSCGENPEEEVDGTSGEEQTEAPVILGDFKITEEVKIIYPDRANTTIKNACKMIAQAILDTYGINVKVGSDWNLAQGPEIIVSGIQRSFLCQRLRLFGALRNRDRHFRQK